MQQSFDYKPDVFTLQPYPKEITDLLTLEGFSCKFYELTQLHSTYEEAYEQCESLHLKYFRHRKYSCYNSFRNRMRENRR